MRWRTCSALYLALPLLSAQPAAALSSSEALARARAEVRAAVAAPAPASLAVPRPPTPVQRIAAAELLLRTRDRERAIGDLNQVLELYQQGQADRNAHADALFLLAEAYFADEQLLAARRHYRALLDQTPAQPYLVHAGRALARLVDIAQRRAERTALDDVFSRLARLPNDATGALGYARAKAEHARGDGAAARAAAEQVVRGSPLYPQTLYLLGVIDLERALADFATPPQQEREQALLDRFAQAVTQFQRVTGLEVTTAEHRHVIDLAWLALGRIFHELSSYRQAADAYGRVRSESPERETAWYELSWVYLRMGDHARALQLLQVIDLAARDTLARADSTLLAGDLLLRDEQFDAALHVHQQARRQYEPVRAKLQTLLGAQRTPGSYFQWLIAEPVGPATLAQPPQPAVRWAREVVEDSGLALLTRDVADCRTLLAQGREMETKLLGALQSAARPRLFPEQKTQLERWLGGLNRVARARYWVASALDEGSEAGSGELASVRAQRRALMSTVVSLPRTRAEFAQRERAGERQWADVSRDLQRATLETNRLQALINGLQRLLDEHEQSGQPALANGAALRRELASKANEIAEYHALVAQYRHAVDAGRVQVGFGDPRFSGDAKLRSRFAALLERELALLAAGAGGSEVALARAGQSLLQNAGQNERWLLDRTREVTARIDAEAAAVRQTVAREQALLAAHRQQLAALEREAESLLGEEARSAFQMVHDRLHGIVLRSDVALGERAWEMRESALSELERLQRARSTGLDEIDREQRDVLETPVGEAR